MQQGVAQNTGWIYWQQDSLLKWSDFKAKPDSTINYTALSTTGIDMKPRASVKNNKVLVKYELRAYFNPKYSWSRKERETPKILHHEQIHFDIAECIARIGMIELDKYAETDARKIKTEIDALMKTLGTKVGEMHKRYDDQTVHGSNDRMQQKWAEYTADLIKNPTTLEEAWKKMPTTN